MLKRYLIGTVLALAIISSAECSEYYGRYSQTALGGIGLIQTPTARSQNDGAFAFGVSAESPYNRMFSRVQIFPRVEASSMPALSLAALLSL